MRLKSHSFALACGDMAFSTFKVKHGASEARLMAAVDRRIEGLHTNEVEFLGHALLKDSEDTSMDVLLATSQACAAELCGTWDAGPYASARLPCLEKMEKDSIQPAFFEPVH